MRSIRLSLLGYFLGLVTAALAGASLMVDNIAQRTLRDKEEAARKLIDARFDERSRETRNRLDDRLLANARALAGRVRPRSSRRVWDRIGSRYTHLYGMTILIGSLNPSAQISNLVAFQHLAPLKRERGRWPTMSPLQQQIWFSSMIDLSMGDEVETPEDVVLPHIASRIQTNGYSRSLYVPAKSKLKLSSEETFASDKNLDWAFDTASLRDGTRVRRILFRAKLRLEETGPPAPTPPLPPAPGIYRRPPPALIIQCAANHADLEAEIASLRAKRDAERQNLHKETIATLASLRQWLLVVCGVTFAATILGCIGLVWLGLRPLHRLSHAVSLVTPKNFTITNEDERLPVELRPIVETLTNTLDLLKRAFAREKQATADISHELRTPLAALLTTIELALRKDRTPEQYRELLQECHFSAKQMHQMVERLLTLARLDAGVDRLRPQPVDVVQLAEQCATVVRPLAEARGLQLAVLNDCPDSSSEESFHCAQLTTDPDKLREVLNNLLHNAIQYNRPDGRIDLKVSRHNGHVEMEVHDTGIGIPEQARERIFERFYRADPSRNGDGLHTGLGLAIVKEYVELMGGKISVESEEGQGSTFRLQLPAA